MQPFASYFDDVDTAAISQALDLAYGEVAPVIGDDRADSARDLLASLVLELASQGETEPKALCDYALRRFSPVLPYFTPNAAQ